MTATDALVETLPLLQRLALSHAPSAARAPTLALFALDTRLAGIVRNSREPMLAQLRLSWWREQLARDVAQWPAGDPLLEALRSWGPRVGMLSTLVDGWEALTGPAPLPEDAFASLAQARGRAFGELAGVLGKPGASETASRLGANWALADLAGRVGHAVEREILHRLIRGRDWRHARLPRSLRPLAVLHGLASRSIGRDEPPGALSPGGVLVALRIGLLGR